MPVLPMRYFLRSRIPEPHRVLVVESGSRWIMEKALASMRTIFSQARFDLCTCFPEAPAAGVFENVFRVSQASGLAAKLSMARAIRRTRPAIAAVLFTGEAIMLPWKLLLLAVLPSKVLVVNENGDFFWLDWAHRHVLRQFLGARSGVDGLELFRVIYRMAFFPVALVFLSVSAARAYLTRWVRLMFWRLSHDPDSKR